MGVVRNRSVLITSVQPFDGDGTPRPVSGKLCS
jgi:hypothetical protein